MTEPTVYRDADFLSPDGSCHGLSCADCGDVFVNGQPISERLDGFTDDVPVVVLTCVPCGLAVALRA